ncbi:conjugal transfer protein TraF [Natronospira bacteriovora]|uniref:Conjugal transfer protein TraF n=1 Tax=Natronospira bacteriovora TaxID=3069753 RepID=A0ABU0W9L0_9GAMM|nr:conjugal transfer protein TraF [Natronospira sp. AB-CW4]MDQ2070120.1 conjugal transfer protein TraF [Natronospira sp. AB-CW4]
MRSTDSQARAHPLRNLTCSLGLALALGLPIQALGNAFTALDARSLSLGGSGVASTRPYNAPFFNPARLAGNPQVEGRRDELTFLRPYVGVRLIDRDGFLDALDQYQENDNSSRLDTALDELEQSLRDLDPNREDFLAVTTAGNALLDDYQNLSDKPLRLVGSGGMNVGYPSERWGFGAHQRINGAIGMEIRVSESDIAAVREVLDFIDFLVELVDADELPDDVDLPVLPDDFQSEFALQGMLVEETGLSLAAQIPGMRRTSVGVTLKQLRVETLDWRTEVDDAESDNFDREQQSLTYTDSNIDIGLTHELDEHWTAGLMVRNAIARDYLTVLGNEVRLRPVARVGLAWQNEQWTVAWDMDLNETEAVGFDPRKQFIAMGAEYRPWRWLALRGGYRHERVLEEGELSLGFGLAMRHAHFDLGVSTDGRDSMAAALQFGVRF